MSLSFEIRYLWIDLIFQRFIMFLKSLTCGLFENIPVMPRYRLPRKHVYLSCVMKICSVDKTFKFRITWWNEWAAIGLQLVISLLEVNREGGVGGIQDLWKAVYIMVCVGCKRLGLWNTFWCGYWIGSEHTVFDVTLSAFSRPSLFVWQIWGIKMQD